MPSRPASLAGTALRQMGLRLLVVTAVVTVLSWWHVAGTLRAQAMEHLRQTVALRSARERTRFDLARDNLLAWAKEWDRQLDRLGDSDPVAAFTAQVTTWGDGTRRTPLTSFDGKHDTGVFIRADVAIDSDIRRRVVVAKSVIERWGPAWLDRFTDLWYGSDESILVLFWPDFASYVPDLPATHSMQPEEYLAVAKAGVPGRVDWTGVYLDPPSQAWLVSSILPLHRPPAAGRTGPFAGFISHDLTLNDLIDRTREDHLPGTYNVLFRHDGRLLAHPQLTARIQASKGAFTIADAKDPLLDQIFEAARATTGDTEVVESGDGRYLLGIARIPGPDWFVVTVIPRDVVEAPANATARWILFLGVASLVIEMLMLWTVLRRQVSDPLARVDEAAGRIAGGDRSLRLDVGRPDEIGRLARSFDAMVAAVSERDAVLERRVAERTAELAAALAELESFSYSVSHDLRAPLRAISGFGEILEEDHGAHLDAEGRRVLGVVRREARRMGELIDDLLSLAKVSRAPLERQRVDASAMAQAVIEQLRHQDPGRQVEVLIDPGIQLSADPGMTRIVLDNLLSNAWKYTSRSPRPVITVRAIPDGIAIEDNGAGFDPASAGRLFQAFTRLHRAEEFPGTGIGLAIVARIAARHGGAVAADGRTDEGARMTVTFGAVVPG